jgi:hypothetical protein
MNDAHPQRHTEEEISTMPTLFAVNSLGNDRDSSWDPKVSLSSGPNQPSLDQQLSKHNTTISAIEKSFKDEEYIYVSISSLHLDL